MKKILLILLCITLTGCGMSLRSDKTALKELEQNFPNKKIWQTNNYNYEFLVEINKNEYLFVYRDFLSLRYEPLREVSMTKRIHSK